MISAVAQTIPTDRLELVEVDDLTPGQGELIVEVEACGVCGTDLHILEGHSYRPQTPFTLGHEPVGRVWAAGTSDDAVWLERRVTLTLFEGCGYCELCLCGDERLCPDLASIVGVKGRPGGFAEQLRIRTAQAVEVPASLTPLQVATLVDAGATAANSVRTIESSPAGMLVVVGGGPVGFFAAELARLGGWDVTVVQPSLLRRLALQGLGHNVVSSLEDVKSRPSVVIDAAGAAAVAPWALEVLAPRGMLVAAAYGVLGQLDFGPAARKELRIVGIRSGDRRDLERVLGLAAGGSIRMPEVAMWPLGEINDALVALRAKTVAGKAVIVPSQSVEGRHG